jgi:hypothetical protein
MIKQNNHRINYLGTTIFQILLFICISTFNETSVKPNNNKSQYEIASVHSPLIVLNNFPQLSFNNRLVSLINKENFKLFNQHFKLLTDNRLLSQQYFFLQKAELSIKAITPPGFYFHCLYTDTEEPPVLS